MNVRGSERRRALRHQQVDEQGAVSVRIKPGHAARLIDVSTGGALVETNCRLLPGREVELHMETPTRRAAVRGRVLRCEVVRLRASSISYRGAIAFDRSLPWFADEPGYHVPTADMRRGGPFRAQATPQVV
jgi:hypothetical protein